MAHHQHHHLIAHILHLLAGGGLGLLAAALAHQFGMRSAERMPGDSRAPHCFFCLRRLTWQEISPLFSWILRPDTLQFPCPCGLRKGLWSQPVAEILGLLLGMIGMQIAGWSWMAVPLCVAIGLLVAIALIDFHFGIIPDGLNILIALLGLWWTLASGNDVWLALIVAGGLLVVGLFCALGYSRWRGQEMLGLGDVKFFAAAGLWLQPDVAPWFLSLAGVIGGVSGITWQRLGRGKEFPFGPALCLSLILCVIYQMVRTPFGLFWP